MIDLLKALQGQVSLINRLRLDAALYEPVPVALPGQHGRKRLKGVGLPTLLKVAEDKTTRWPTGRVVNRKQSTTLPVLPCGITQAKSLWPSAGGC